MGGSSVITVPARHPGTRHRLGRSHVPRKAAQVDGNTPRDRIPFDLTRDPTTTAHAAEESPG